MNQYKNLENEIPYHLKQDGLLELQIYYNLLTKLIQLYYVLVVMVLQMVN